MRIKVFLIALIFILLYLVIASNSSAVILICINSFLFSVFLPDLYIKDFLDYIRKPLKIKTEKEKWRYLPQILGDVERALYWIVWCLFPSNFILFLSVWLGLKTVVDYQFWKVSGNGVRGIIKGRCRFFLFLIGSGLSILSVLLIHTFFKFIIQSLLFI